MPIERLIARLQRILKRLPDDSQAAALLEDVIAELQDGAVSAQGGGNGNGPPR